MDLLRICSVGSVDDGKSTLLGRLLLDTDNLKKDLITQVEGYSAKRGDQYTDLALYTDGLKSEREQGITIDVAYRYFSTERRKFVLIDCPGHVQYTRNMVTGASNAQLALTLVDARNGLVEQSKRHILLASLLRIPHMVICVNKMDLVEDSKACFEKIRQDFENFAQKLQFTDVEFIPISALYGDNVVNRSDKLPWYSGRTLLDHLESVYIASDKNLIDFRFPVQNVVRPHAEEHHDFRGYGGQIVSGAVKVGEEVCALPSGFRSKIRSIHLGEESLSEAEVPQSITVTLEDDIDIARGSMLVRANNQPEARQDLNLNLCWLAETPMNLSKRYLVRHTTKEVKSMVKEILYKLDIQTLGRSEDSSALAMNEIARVRLRCSEVLQSDLYSKNRATGSVILIDPDTNSTVAAGMII